MACENLTPPEVAHQYRVSRATVYRWIRRGVGGIKLGVLRVGGQWRVSPVDIDLFFGRLREKAMGGPAAVPAGEISDAGELAKRIEAARERLKLRGV